MNIYIIYKINHYHKKENISGFSESYIYVVTSRYVSVIILIKKHIFHDNMIGIIQFIHYQIRISFPKTP